MDAVAWKAMAISTGQPAAAHAGESVPYRGSFVGQDGKEARVELRIDAAVVSGDIFRLHPAGEAWVASFRTGSTTVPSIGKMLAVTGADRLGARGGGQLMLGADGAGLSLSLVFDEELDSLPVGQPIRAEMLHQGAALRRLSVDLWRENGVAAIPRLDRDGAPFGLEEAMAASGIDAFRTEHPVRVSKMPSGGWSDTQLHTLMHDFATADTDPARFRLRLLWLSRSQTPRAQGVMFDDDEFPRQGVAVFAGHIAATTAPALLKQKLLQVAVHEIGHALNLTHPFERQGGVSTSLSFMNYDWRYAGGADRFWEDFNFCFDDIETEFFHHGSFRAVVPGGDRFGSSQYWAETSHGYLPAADPQSLSPIARLDILPPVDGPVFAHGQPVILGLRLTNLSTEPWDIPPDLLDQKNGALTVTVQRETSGFAGIPIPFHPMTRRCVASSTAPVTLSAGSAVEDNVNLTFGTNGFAFAEPGTYRVTAWLATGLEGMEMPLPSQPLRIRILTPMTIDEDRAALDIFDPRAGAILALGGTAAYEAAALRLLDVAERLTSAGRVRTRTHPVATGLYRSLCFHFRRDYVRLRGDRFARSSARAEEARQCSSRLTNPALGVLDPVSGQATRAFVAQLRAESSETGRG